MRCNIRAVIVVSVNSVLAQPALQLRSLSRNPSAQPSPSQCVRDSLYDIFHDANHSATAADFYNTFIDSATQIVTATITVNPTDIVSHRTYLVFADIHDSACRRMIHIWKLNTYYPTQRAAALK
ncbi:hypothetical protein SCAR479_07155 [Seiridium cardinale]|uniref:Uncharacterized protein n=1 Tax=Seiridium cardinale TaxID=138064 RepID=A0ABR2XR56_9PEZI